MDIACKFFDDIEELKRCGMYIKANQRLRDAAQEDPNDPNIYYHWAALAKNQGLLGDAKAHIERSKAILSQESIKNELQHDLFQILAMTIDHYMIGTSSESASLATEIFETHLRHRRIDDYSAFALRLLFDYYDLRSRLQHTGDERYIVTPNLGSEFFWNLYQRLIQEGQFRNAAFLISRFEYDGGIGSGIGTKMIQDMISQPSLPISVRAFCLLYQTNSMRDSNRRPEQWIPIAEEAVRLFQSIGNIQSANSMRIKIMSESGSELDLVQASGEMAKFAQVAEERGDALLAIEAFLTIQDIYRLAQTDIPSGISSEAASQLERLFRKTQLHWLDLSHRFMALCKLEVTEQQPGELLPFYEQLLREVKSKNYTSLTLSVSRLLHSVYLKLGDLPKAQALLDDMALVLPANTRVVHRLESFHRSIEAAKNIPDQDKAYNELCVEIEAAQADADSSKDPIDKANTVRWLQTLQLSYSQIPLTDHTFQPSRFVERCREAILGLSSSKSFEQADSVSYNDMYSKAWTHCKNSIMAFIKAKGFITAEIEAEIGIALYLYLEAAASNWSSRNAHSKAASYSQVAMCYEHRWNFQRRPIQSEDFVKADHYSRVALAIFRDAGFLNGQLLVIDNLFSLWKVGIESSITIPDKDPADVLLEICKDVEKLSAQQRVDRSALKSLQAITAKQALSNKDVMQKAYTAAVDLLLSREDGPGLWSWIQRSKSRSVSDALALGVKMPAKLSSAIEQNHDVRGMLQHERELVQRLQGSEGRDLKLQNEIEAFRNKMKQNELLHAVFSLREGRPTTLQALRDVRSRLDNLQYPSRTKTVFVDWFLSEGNEIYCIIATDDSDAIHFESTTMTVADIKEWKVHYLGGDDDQDWSGNSALEALAKLIRPILKMSSPKELLILCPTGVLHGIPIHAALVDNDTSTSLIERNPVVYTSSMTTFEYGISRQLDHVHTDDKLAKNHFVSVFETLEESPLDEGGKDLRDHVYATFRDLAQKMPDSSTVEGFDVTSDRLAKALEADFVSFFGHCSFQPDHYLDQGLMLAEKTDDNPSTAPTSTLFKASQMFDVHVRASNVMLLACGSASQSYNRGDEPLGITTALLCAGASSVTGTLWKASVNAALTFNTAFHSALSREQSRSDDSEAIHLARVVQEAVCRLKSRPSTKSPLQWANFVLYGSWFMRRS